MGFLRARAWNQKHPKIEQVQREVASIKSTLSVVLQAANSYYQNADPNIIDMYLAPPVSYAADQGQTLCVKLLLEAGAVAEPILPPGIKLGSPLNCAARNTKDPTLLKYLLTYGAQVDSTGIDGNTAPTYSKSQRCTQMLRQSKYSQRPTTLS